MGLIITMKTDNCYINVNIAGVKDNSMVPPRPTQAPLPIMWIVIGSVSGGMALIFFIVVVSLCVTAPRRNQALSKSALPPYPSLPMSYGSGESCISLFYALAYSS